MTQTPTAAIDKPKQTTKRLPPKINESASADGNFIELNPNKQQNLEQKQTKKNQKKHVVVVEAAVLEKDNGEREALHNYKVEDKIEAKKSRNRGKTTVPDKGQSIVQP